MHLILRNFFKYIQYNIPFTGKVKLKTVYRLSFALHSVVVHILFTKSKHATILIGAFFIVFYCFYLTISDHRYDHLVWPRNAINVRCYLPVTYRTDIDIFPFKCKCKKIIKHPIKSILKKGSVPHPPYFTLYKMHSHSCPVHTFSQILMFRSTNSCNGWPARQLRKEI